MQPVLLGTGASEGIPAIFCECPVCAHARAHGGRNIRTRSALLFDRETLVDFSPDIFHQLLPFAFSLRELKRIFLTHFHEDHFNILDMGARNCGVPKLEAPVDLICSPPMAEQMRLLFDRFRDHNREVPFNYFRNYRFVELRPFQEAAFGEITATPILSSHHSYGVKEIGYNYLLSKGGKTLLYAADTGWFPEETWAFLAGKTIDLAVMECTYGSHRLPPFAEEHLDFGNLTRMAEKLESLGCITKQTPLFLTHICHLNTVLPEQMPEYLAGIPYNITAGYDGMELPFWN